MSHHHLGSVFTELAKYQAMPNIFPSNETGVFSGTSLPLVEGVNQFHSSDNYSPPNFQHSDLDRAVTIQSQDLSLIQVCEGDQYKEVAVKDQDISKNILIIHESTNREPCNDNRKSKIIQIASMMII